MKTSERLTNAVRLVLVSLVLNFICLVSSAVQAHPIEFHMHPLDAAGVERVLNSLDWMISEIERNDAMDTARRPDDAMGITALLWSLQQALVRVNDTGMLESPAFKDALFSVGYEDSRHVIEEWQAEAEQVLETYEVIERKLDIDNVRARYAAFEGERPQLEEQRDIELESVLIRDWQLVRTTMQDRSLVEIYKPRLDALAARLGQ